MMFCCQLPWKKRVELLRRSLDIEDWSFGVSRMAPFGQPPLLMERLRNKINRLKPHMLYVPHAAEMHSDHRAAARLVRRVLRYVANPPEVRFYEVWTPLQQIDHVQDISAQLR